MRRFLLVGLSMCMASAAYSDIIYRNLASFSGTGGTSTYEANFYNGGATVANAITQLVADDITFASGYAGQSVNKIYWTLVNGNSVAVSARMRLRFYDTDGVSGGPGTVLAGYTFNPATFNASTIYTYNFAPGAGELVVPASGQMWAGITFDNVGATATATQLNSLGQGIMNSPDVGTSTDVFFQATSPGSSLVNNPAGSLFSFSGNPVANFGWQFEAVPEPATMAVVGMGALALLRRRRK